MELLRPLLGYARGVGVDARWLVIDGTSAFYEVTKRIHNQLHGFGGDGGPLDELARRIYEDALAENVAAFARLVRPAMSLFSMIRRLREWRPRYAVAAR